MSAASQSQDSHPDSRDQPQQQEQQRREYRPPAVPLQPYQIEAYADGWEQYQQQRTAEQENAAHQQRSDTKTTAEPDLQTTLGDADSLCVCVLAPSRSHLRPSPTSCCRCDSPPIDTTTTTVLQLSWHHRSHRRTSICRITHRSNEHGTPNKAFLSHVAPRSAPRRRARTTTADCSPSSSKRWTTRSRRERSHREDHSVACKLQLSSAFQPHRRSARSCIKYARSVLFVKQPRRIVRWKRPTTCNERDHARDHGAEVARAVGIVFVGEVVLAVRSGPRRPERESPLCISTKRPRRKRSM
jgi:hypothetical protein